MDTLPTWSQYTSPHLMVLLTSRTHTLKALVPIVVSKLTVLAPTVFFYMKPRNTHSLHCPCSHKSSGGLRATSYQGTLVFISVLGLDEHHDVWLPRGVQHIFNSLIKKTGGNTDQPFPSSSRSSVVGRVISRALFDLPCFCGKLLPALYSTFLYSHSLLL